MRQPVSSNRKQLKSLSKTDLLRLIREWSKEHNHDWGIAGPHLWNKQRLLEVATHLDLRP
jgi:hypothetical protein